MKTIAVLVLSFLLVGVAFADQWVNGYTRKDGTYVNGYMRSDSDSSYNNNWSVQGNVNPYSGEEGTRSRTYNDRTPEYNNRTYGNPGYESGSSYGGYGSSGSNKGRRSYYGY